MLFAGGVDAHVGLALALDTQPGRFAVLLGAGVSVAAGMPSAWDVEQELIRRVAVAGGLPAPEDPSAWWAARSGPAGYDDLLGALSTTPAGRPALLRGFFEPDQEERERGEKVPSAAHRAVARLVVAGRIRVVLTLNFDTLMETALRDEGVEPVVVTSPDGLGGIEPLQHQRALVVHLHGQYLSSDTLNTSAELASYDERLDDFLDEVFDRYGLLVAGWSARWDVALRRRLEAARSPRYGTWWVDVVPLAEPAAGLAAARGATVVTGEAGGFLGLAADSADALADRRAADPLTGPAAAGYAKRALSGRTVAIPLHDALRRELGSVMALDAVTTADFAGGNDAETARRRDQVLAGTRTLLTLVSTTAYWGDDGTDRWWLPDIVRLVGDRLDGGLLHLIGMTRAPAVLVAQTAGVAAAAAGRAPLLVELLQGMEVGWPGQEPLPAGLVLDPSVVWPTGPDPELSLREHLRPVLADDLGLGAAAFGEAWERWTLLRYLARQDAHEHGRRSGFGFFPLLRAAALVEPYTASASVRLRRDLRRLGAREPLVAAGMFDGDPDRAVALLDAFDAEYDKWADKAAWAAVPAGGGTLPTGPHYPARRGLKG